MRWEYLAVAWVHISNAEAATFQAQTLGNDGWELVGFHGDLAYFKRAVVSEPSKVKEAHLSEQQVEEIAGRVLERVVASISDL